MQNDRTVSRRMQRPHAPRAHTEIFVVAIIASAITGCGDQKSESSCPVSASVAACSADEAGKGVRGGPAKLDHSLSEKSALLRAQRRRRESRRQRSRDHLLQAAAVGGRERQPETARSQRRWYDAAAGARLAGRLAVFAMRSQTVRNNAAATAPPMTVLDTTSISIDTAVDAVAEWVGGALRI